MTRAEMAQRIEGFLDGTSGPRDWDDFCSFRLRDPELETLRQQCCDVDLTFPPTRPSEYCNDEGVAFLRGIVRRLRGEAV
jgi:hypothetical protein